MNFGFVGSQDIVPAIYKNLNMEKRARIFLTLYNANVDKEYRIPFKFVKNVKNLKEIFTNFISDSFENKNLNFKKCQKFCILSNVVLYSYLNGKNFELYGKIPLMKAAKIACILNNEKNFGILLCMQSSFNNFVYDKICASNKTNDIYLKDEMIVIQKQGFGKLGVIPCYREIFDIKSDNLDDDIKNALRLKCLDDINKIYIVYPKNENFTKHVEVKSCEFDKNFILKLVPYCISNKIFERK